MFAIRFPLHVEMERFRGIMQADPDRGRQLFLGGEELITFAVNGNFRKFCEAAFRLGAEDGFPVNYFVSKAFTSTFLHHHLLIASFLIDNGYPVNNTLCPNVLIECIKANLDDDSCCEAVEFLATKKFDFNVQEDKTWMAPIHYAVKHAMPRTVEVLIKNMADVNSVAENDVLPLVIANSLPDSPQKQEILQLLQLK